MQLAGSVFCLHFRQKDVKICHWNIYTINTRRIRRIWIYLRIHCWVWCWCCCQLYIIFFTWGSLENYNDPTTPTAFASPYSPMEDERARRESNDSHQADLSFTPEIKDERRPSKDKIIANEKGMYLCMFMSSTNNSGQSSITLTNWPTLCFRHNRLHHFWWHHQPFLW